VLILSQFNLNRYFLKEEEMDEKWMVYINGDILPIRDAKLSVFDRGFQYGDGVFEGLRCYDGRIFKLEEHVLRLFESARAIHIKIPLSHTEMKEAIKDIIRTNGFKNAHIKPFVTRGYGWKLGLDPKNASTPNIVIIARPTAESMYGQAGGGLRLAVVSVRKTPTSCLDPRIKSLNYLVNILARAEAQASGADEAIMLDIRGFISEGSADNIFLVRRGALWTPPVQSALEGITRQTIIDLAKEASHEAPLTMYDVCTADEVFVTGSGAGIIPVVEVDKKPVKEGKPGQLTQRLSELYAEAVKEGEPVE
jgi:branched-chain amino acid aminotransferase